MTGKPRYFQIYQDLVQKINDGIIKEGSFLPTEKELQDSYSVSRTTIREAVKILVERGLVQKMPGVGIVVDSSKIYLDSSKLSSFKEEHRFHELDAILSEYKEYKADDHLRYKMKLPKGSSVSYHKKVRKVDGHQVGFQKVYIPITFLDISKDDLEDKNFSFYSFLEKHDIVIDKAIEVIEAIVADEEISRILGVEIGHPILYLDRITYDIQGRIIEYAQIFYISNFYRYKIELKRNYSR